MGTVTGDLRGLRVALLHDWITSFRGGERVLEALCEMFPQAPIYTLVHVPGSVPTSIESHKIYASFLNRIPRIGSQYRKFLPLFPTAADSLKITEPVDLVLSSSHCVIKGVQKPRGARHLSYVHSPMRYIYDQYDVYFGPGTPMAQRMAARMVRGYLTRYDLRTNQNVDRMLANSGFVQKRISKYYGMPSTVVYPFVGLDDFRAVQAAPAAKKEYFVMVTAFAPNKRVDLAIRAFNEMGLNLKIVGSGQQEAELRAMAGPNVEFMGNASRSEVVQLLAEAQALIFPGVEDFGIVPLEAMASGTPVIAFQAGGVLETLNEKVALFFDEPTEDSLKNAVRSFQGKSWLRQDLWQRAEEFSKARFVENIKEQIGLTLA